MLRVSAKKPIRHVTVASRQQTTGEKMNVSNVGSSCGTSQSAWQSQFKKVKDDFQKLKSALDSGDASGAQDAYATLKQDLPAPKSDASSSQPQTDLQSV